MSEFESHIHPLRNVTSPSHGRLPFGRKAYSTNPAAVAARTRMLTDDAASDRAAATRKKASAAKRGKEVFKTFTLRKLGAVPLDRIRFHLSKGRDAGSIAVRENLPVSWVLAAIASLTNPKA